MTKNIDYYKEPGINKAPLHVLMHCPLGVVPIAHIYNLPGNDKRITGPELRALAHALIDVSHDLDNFDPVKTPLLRKCYPLELTMQNANDGVAEFYAEWSANKLPVPFTPCKQSQLYDAYAIWCEDRITPATAEEFYTAIWHSSSKTLKLHRRTTGENIFASKYTRLTENLDDLTFIFDEALAAYLEQSRNIPEGCEGLQAVIFAPPEAPASKHFNYAEIIARLNSRGIGFDTTNYNNGTSSTITIDFVFADHLGRTNRMPAYYNPANGNWNTNEPEGDYMEKSHCRTGHPQYDALVELLCKVSP